MGRLGSALSAGQGGWNPALQPKQDKNQGGFGMRSPPFQLVAKSSLLGEDTKKPGGFSPQPGSPEAGREANTGLSLFAQVHFKGCY